MSELKQAWEYSFIHSSATGRGDEEIGPCLTYDKASAFGKGCIKQREVFICTQPEATKPAQDLGAAILRLQFEDSESDYKDGYNRAIRTAAALASPANALVAVDSDPSDTEMLDFIDSRKLHIQACYAGLTEQPVYEISVLEGNIGDESLNCFSAGMTLRDAIRDAMENKGAIDAAIQAQKDGHK